MTDSNSTTSPEVCSFRMHPALLHSVIKQQAGSLEKALAELAQNACDAKATQVTMTITRHSFKVVDDGLGIRDRASLDSFWATFGTPHKDGDSTFGKFRMGRGQAFAFGAQTWRTGEFLMDVDIRGRGLAFTIQSGLPEAPGCTIEATLYSALLQSELAGLLAILEKQLRYFPIPLCVNGKMINKSTATEEWDHESDDAFIKFKDSGPLVLYNMGVLVREYHSSQHGASGLICSKVPLEVNFARNDVLTTECAVWKRVRNFLNERNAKQANEQATKKRLTADERDNLASQLIDRRIRPSQAWKMKLITDVCGHHHDLESLDSLRLPITSAPRDSALGDVVHKAKVAFVISRATLERFNVDDPRQLLDRLQEICATDPMCARPRYTHIATAPLESFAPLFQNGYEVIAPKDLKRDERLGRDALVDIGRVICIAINRKMSHGAVLREIRIGRSDLAEAWTDGNNVITVERHQLAKFNRGPVGVAHLAALLAHEYTHSSNSAGSHMHDGDFYEAFHDLVLDGRTIGHAIRVGVSTYLKGLRRQGGKIPQAYRRIDDEDVAAADEKPTVPCTCANEGATDVQLRLAV